MCCGTSVRCLEHERGPLVHPLEDSPKDRVLAYRGETDRWPKNSRYYEQETQLGKLSPNSELRFQNGSFSKNTGLIAEVYISANARKFVCSMNESKSDVWLIEGFDPDQE